eukprot:gene11277-3317_t
MSSRDDVGCTDLQVSELLTAAMQENMAAYQSLLAQKAHSRDFSQKSSFFDAVILTACDECQAETYKEILNERKERGRLPNTRCASAYFNALSVPRLEMVAQRYTSLAASRVNLVRSGMNLEAKETSTFFTRKNMFLFCDAQHANCTSQGKILLVHAGGFSKRLPNVSAIGKVFTALPIGDTPMTALELKLASYVHVAQKMLPGVFVCAADAIELIDDSSRTLTFDRNGFIALAHPSSLAVGTSHGVFVLDESGKKFAVSAQTKIEQSSCDSCYISKCNKFLHKPSIQEMQIEEAILPETDTVYTDSAFFFDMQTANYLLEFLDENSNLSCEIDAYGDFLQALGTNSTSNYCRNTENVIAVVDDLISVRQRLYDFLNDRKIPLHVAICTKGLPFHISITDPYCFNFRIEVSLAFHKRIFDPILHVDVQVSPKTHFRDYFRNELRLEQCIASVVHDTSSMEIPDNVCIMTSRLDENVTIQPHVIIEASIIPAASRIGRRTLLSCCQFESVVRIPEKTLMHTMAVISGALENVGIDETFKDKAKRNLAGEQLSFCGVTLHTVMKLLGLTLDDLWPNSLTTEVVDLWNAKLFRTAPSAQQSAHDALETIHSLKNNGNDKELGQLTRFSMAQLVVIKDTKGCLRLFDVFGE